MAELRLELHEAQVARRTKELEWSAGAVRLSVLEREHGELQAALAAARAGLEEARRTAAEAEAALEAARAEAAAAQAAHEVTRTTLAEREAELSGARERISALEAELDDVRARVDRVGEEAAEAARIVAVAEALMREQEREEAWAARLAEAEEATALAEGRLAHLEASLDEVETARELAEARAAAAVAARQAAEVALAAARAPATLPPTRRFGRTPPVPAPVAPQATAVDPAAAAADPFEAAAERLRSTATPAAVDADPSPSDTAPPPSPAVTGDGAPPGADESPAETAPPPLASGADAASAETAAPPPASDADAAPADTALPPPASDADAAPADTAPPPSTSAVAFRAPVPPAFAPSPVAPPPVPDAVIAAAAEQVRVAAERASTVDPAERDRVVAGLAAAAEALRSRVAAPAPAVPDDPGPGLAAALVTLARQDAAAAAGLLAGLIPAAHLVVDGDLDADVTLAPAGTFAVVTADGTSTPRPLDKPRGRREAAAHLRTDAVTLARLLAGEDVHPRRFTGPLRVSGSGRRAVQLDRLRTVTAAEALSAGAAPDPVLALRLLALAVPEAWTRGHDFTLAVHGDGGAARIRVRDGRPPAWDPDPVPAGTRILVGPAAVSALLGDGHAGDPWTVEGDPAPAAVLRAWLDRLLAPRA